MTICEQMQNYYTSRYRQRYFIFSKAVNLEQKADLRKEVFNAALAFAAVNYRSDLIEIYDPHVASQGISHVIFNIPTLIEVYSTVIEQVTNTFVSKIKQGTF